MDQSGRRRKVCGTPTRMNGSVDLTPTYSISSDFRWMEGKDGFQGGVDDNDDSSQSTHLYSYARPWHHLKRLEIT